jgi:hypothetical protein
MHRKNFPQSFEKRVGEELELSIKDFLRYHERYRVELKRENQTTKYGYREPIEPQLVVAKNRIIPQHVSHNFFYDFLCFLLTCRKSRL